MISNIIHNFSPESSLHEAVINPLFGDLLRTAVQRGLPQDILLQLGRNALPDIDIAYAKLCDVEEKITHLYLGYSPDRQIDEIIAFHFRDPIGAIHRTSAMLLHIRMLKTQGALANRSDAEVEQEIHDTLLRNPVETWQIVDASTWEPQPA